MKKNHFKKMENISRKDFIGIITRSGILAGLGIITFLIVKKNNDSGKKYLSLCRNCMSLRNCSYNKKRIKCKKFINRKRLKRDGD